MNILLTGSTGFLGTGFLHYLNYYNDKNTYYLLIRDKKNLTALNRFNKIKNNFPELHLELLNISLYEIGSHTLAIDCIINCAASIDFNLPLTDAIQQNVDGLKQLIQFSKKNNVPKFIHISTAYISDCRDELIEETFIDLSMFGDVNMFYDSIKQNKITFDEITQQKFFPNTYTFTKCLAEKMIECEINNNTNIIYSIIRPSIITSAVKIPHNGWFQGYAAYLGLNALIHSEYLSYLKCNLNCSLNIVPIDYVCHTMYLSLSDKQHVIKHSTAILNCKTLGNLEHMYNTVFNNRAVLKATHNTYTILHYKYILFCIRIKMFLIYIYHFFDKTSIRIYNKLDTVYNMTYDTVFNNTFNQFISNTYNFDNKNTVIDRETFKLPEYCDNTGKYTTSIHKSLRSSLNIHDNCLKHSIFTTCYNTFSKYTFSLQLVYLWIASCFVRLFLRSIYKQITIEYKDTDDVDKINSTDKPLVIVSNHQSHIDTFILKYIFLVQPGLKITNPTVIASDEFKMLPSYLKYLIEFTGMKYISKTSFDKEDYIKYIKDGLKGNLLFYPEGSRSRDRHIHKFKSGLYDITMDNLDANVLPITITYSNVPETNTFIKSLINEEKITFFNLFNMIKCVVRHLFSSPKENCHIIIDDFVKAPKQPISSIEETVNLNHHYLLNKYNKTLNINNDTNDCIQYYFNNVQYARYNNCSYTDFQEFIIGKHKSYDDNKVSRVNNIKINNNRLFYPIYSDFITLHTNTDRPLFLGVYSRKIYEKMIKQEKQHLFLNDLKNIGTTAEKYNLIVGVTGLIGTNFFNSIISDKHTLMTNKHIIISRNIESNRVVKYNSHEFHLMRGDINNIQQLCDFDYKLYNTVQIFHFGGVVCHTTNKTDISNMWRTNVEGTKQLCAIAELNQKLNGNCLFVYLSTSGVISCKDNTSLSLLDENTNYSKTTENFPYYNSKIEAEKYVISHSAKHSYKLLVFRPSMVFGKQNTDVLKSVLGINVVNIKRDIFYKIKHKRLLFCSDTYINAITIDELIDCIHKAICFILNETAVSTTEIYNLSGNNYKLKDVFKYYNNTRYISINSNTVDKIITLTDKVNIYPSLYYYLRMSVLDWRINNSKAETILDFRPANIFDTCDTSDNYINFPIFGKMYYE